MTNTAIDEFASGLRIEDEYALMQSTGEAFFSENYWFFGYDAASQIGHFLHVSAVPNKYDLRQEKVMLYLPGGDDFLYVFGEGRQCTPERPGAANLVMHCEQPFRRWRTTYDGTAQRFAAREMMDGTISYGPRVHMKLDLEIECVTPIWVAGRNISKADLEAKKRAESARHGSTGFSSHYEQLYRARGQLTADGKSFEIGGTGIRDHSRGPRDLSNFGSHQLFSCYFQSGRGFGLMRNFDREGNEVWNDAYVVEDGRIRSARVLEATELTNLETRGARIVVRLDLGNGEVATIEGEQQTAILLRMAYPNNSFAGVNRSQDSVWGPILSEGHTRFVWDGETSYGQTERSSPLGRLLGR
jgi:hypothetical protein